MRLLGLAAVGLAMGLAISGRLLAADGDVIKRTNPGDAKWCSSPAGAEWIMGQWNAQADDQIAAIWARQPYVGGQIPSPVMTEMGQKIASVEKSVGGFMPCFGSPGACNPALPGHACQATVKLANGSIVSGTFYTHQPSGLPPSIAFQSDAQRKKLLE